MARTTKAQSAIITRLMTAHADALAGVLAKGAPGYSEAEKNRLSADLVTVSKYLADRNIAPTTHKACAAQPALVEQAPKGTGWEARRQRIAARKAAPKGQKVAPKASPKGKAAKAAPKAAPKGQKLDCRLDRNNITARVSRKAFEAAGTDFAGVYMLTCDERYVVLAGSRKGIEAVAKKLA